MASRFGFLIITILVLLLVGCSSGSLNTTTSNNPQSDIQAMANQFVESYANLQGFSGVAITAQCNGMNNSQPITVYAGTIGYPNFDSRSIESNSLWQIGSNTKSFLSVVLLQLASESQYGFSLDDPLSKWLPQYNYWSLNGQSPTIRQMLHMVSGIPDNTTESLVYWIFKNPYIYLSPKASIDYAPESLDFFPGSQFEYSNTNYEILGLLITTITNNSPDIEIENRINDKLGLHNTYMVDNLPNQVIESSVLMHGYFESVQYPINIPGTDISLWTLSWGYTAGNMISTTQDINTYYRALWTTNTLLNGSQLAQLSSFVSRLTGQPVGSPALDPQGLVYGLGIDAVDFNVYNQYINKNYGESYIPSTDTNILNHLNNYNLVYTYTGSTLGFNFIYFYNPSNTASVVVGYNSNASDPTLSLPFSILNYMDPICHQ